MPAHKKKRSAKIGLPPGSLVHIGSKLSDTTTITILDYNHSSHTEREAASLAECSLPSDAQTVRWINVDAVHDAPLLEQIGTCFALHPLTIEDILNTDQRPKMEDFGDYIYIVLKMFVPPSAGIETPLSEQISIILGKNYVLSFQERKSAVFTPLRERIKSSKGRITKSGADYLAYAIVDTIVDNYFGILETKEEKMDALEEMLVLDATSTTIHAIQSLKRDMIYMRKAVWPLREAINNLGRSESPLIDNATRQYLKDVYDHTIQIIDTVETFRDMLSGMLDIYMSSMSNKMNEIMKVLTIIATIFIPLTFIVGLYGMNFKYMPELELRWGYFAVWGVMIAVVIFMVFYFKRKKWL